jgi:hypothetical protein
MWTAAEIMISRGKYYRTEYEHAAVLLHAW